MNYSNDKYNTIVIDIIFLGIINFNFKHFKKLIKMSPKIVIIFLHLLSY